MGRATTNKVTVSRKVIRDILMALVFMLGIFLVVMPIVAVQEGFRATRIWAFCRRRHGWFYLAGMSKRGWYDFLRNNVIPVLPDSVRMIWPRNMHDVPYPRIRTAGRRPECTSRPYLVYIGRRRIHWVSVNQSLQALKPFAKRSSETQAACRKVIERAMQELQERD